MVSSSAWNGPTLWSHFVAADITHTFHALFAEQLSAVCDRREFSLKMAALMRQWREEHWDDIFIATAARRGASSDGERRVRKRGENDATNTGTAWQWRRGVAMYYESIRVQRLMDEVLLFSSSEEEDEAADKARRRRRGLIHTVDEVWRAGKEAQDFLLPVTEWEAPLYYRRVRRPICVASLYCSVWDGETCDYAELKALLMLMRSNCESYNGVGSPLVSACQELVRVGNRAARDAQTQEEDEDAQRGGLVIPSSLLMEAGHSAAVSGGAKGGGSRLFPPLAQEDLAWMFPPRHEAAQLSADKDANNTNTTTTISATMTTAAGAEGESNQDGRRRFFRLCRRPETQAAAELNTTTTTTTSGAAETTGTKRLTLRLRPGVAPSLPAANSCGDEHAKGEEKKKEGEHEKTKKRQGKKGQHDEEENVIHWVCCDECDTWCVVPEKIQPTPEYWNCTFIGKQCNPSKVKKKKKQKQESRAPRKEQKERSSAKKTRGEGENNASDTVKREVKKENIASKQAERSSVHDDNTHKNSVHIKGEGKNGPGSLQMRSSKTKTTKNSHSSTSQSRRARPRSPSLSSSSSSSLSSSSLTTSSGAAESDSDSSNSDTSDGSRRPVNSRRKAGGQKTSRKQTVKNKKAKRGRKRRRVSSSSSEASDLSVPQSRRAAPVKAEALTLEKLAELEAIMDEVDAMSLEHHKPKEILSKLLHIEKFLR